MIKEKSNKGMDEMLNVDWVDYKKRGKEERKELLKKWLNEWVEDDVAEWFGLSELEMKKEFSRVGIIGDNEYFKLKGEGERYLGLSERRMEDIKKGGIIYWDNFKKLNRGQAKELGEYLEYKFGVKDLALIWEVEVEEIEEEFKKLGVSKAVSPKFEGVINRRLEVGNIKLSEEDMKKYKGEKMVNWGILRELEEGQAKELINYYLKSRNKSKLARDLGVSAPTIGNKMSSLGISTGKGVSKKLRVESVKLSKEEMNKYKGGEVVSWDILKELDEDQARELISYYAKSRTQKELAEEIGVSMPTITKKIKDLGLVGSLYYADGRGSKQKNRKKLKLSKGDIRKYKEEEWIDWKVLKNLKDDQFKDVLGYYLRNESMTEVARCIGVSSDVIYRKMREIGVDRIGIVMASVDENEEEREENKGSKVEKGEGELNEVVNMEGWKEKGEVEEYFKKMGEFLGFIGEDVYVEVKVKKK